MRTALQATGIYPLSTGLLVAFKDPTLIVPRLRSVRVPWGRVADVLPGMQEFCEREYLRRLHHGEKPPEQPFLPLEKWE